MNWKQKWSLNKELYSTRLITGGIVLIGACACAWVIYTEPERKHERRMNTILPCENRVIKYTEGGMWCINDVEVSGDVLEYEPIRASCQKKLENVQALCKPLDR